MRLFYFFILCSLVFLAPIHEEKNWKLNEIEFYQFTYKLKSLVEHRPENREKINSDFLPNFSRDIAVNPNHPMDPGRGKTWIDPKSLFGGEIEGKDLHEIFTNTLNKVIENLNIIVKLGSNDPEYGSYIEKMKTSLDKVCKG